jgi:hypothetical protein
VQRVGAERRHARLLDRWRLLGRLRPHANPQGIDRPAALLQIRQ